MVTRVGETSNVMAREALGQSDQLMLHEEIIIQLVYQEFSVKVQL